MSWVSNGITGRGDAPPCTGTRKGLALVLGTARNVWADVHQLASFYRFGAEIIAINGMMLYWPGRVHHGVSMHPEEMPLWRKLRSIYTDREQSEILTHAVKPPADVLWDIVGATGGTSSLFAVMMGLALGYDRIVLCGVPLDSSGHFYDPPGTETVQFGQEWIETEWKKISAVYFEDRVRSWSGRTKEWFGEPSPKWLEG